MDEKIGEIKMSIDELFRIIGEQQAKIIILQRELSAANERLSKIKPVAVEASGEVD